DPGIVRGPLRSAIPGMTIGIAIVVVFAVGFIVLLVVADEIMEREPVMRGDEIDGRPGAAPILVVGLARGAEPLCQIRCLGATLPEFAHGIAKLIVPLR